MNVAKSVADEKKSYTSGTYSDNLDIHLKKDVYFGNSEKIILSGSFQENSRKWNSQEQVHITKTKRF